MQACKIVNLPPHAITLASETGERTTYPSAGVARVSSTPGDLSERDFVNLDFPVYRSTTYGEVTGLPDSEIGVYYVVSALVGAALRANGIARPDVLLPGTGPNDGAIRNAAGQIEAVTRLLWY